MVKKKKLKPIHPGEWMYEEFLKPLKLDADQLGERLHVPALHITQIIEGKEPITAEMALRLSCFFRTTPQFWMNGQAHYELELAEDAIGDEVKKLIQPYSLVKGKSKQLSLSD